MKSFVAATRIATATPLAGGSCRIELARLKGIPDRRQAWQASIRIRHAGLPLAPDHRPTRE